MNAGDFLPVFCPKPKREMIVCNPGISNRNDFAMLAEIGDKCAGAVTFILAGESPPSPDYHYRALTQR